jgi:hypothetical protein
MRSSSKVVRFEDGSYGRIIKVRSRTVKRTSIATVVRSYVDLHLSSCHPHRRTIPRLRATLTAYRTCVEYIYEEMLEAPDDVIQ